MYWKTTTNTNEASYWRAHPLSRSSYAQSWQGKNAAYHRESIRWFIGKFDYELRTTHQYQAFRNDTTAFRNTRTTHHFTPHKTIPTPTSMLSQSHIDLIGEHFRSNPMEQDPRDPMQRLMEAIAEVRAESAAQAPNREVAMLTSRGGYLYTEPKSAKRNGRK